MIHRYTYIKDIYIYKIKIFDFNFLMHALIIYLVENYCELKKITVIDVVFLNYLLIFTYVSFINGS